MQYSGNYYILVRVLFMISDLIDSSCGNMESDGNRLPVTEH